MLRTSERALVLQEIDTAIECMIYTYLLTDKEDDALENIEDLGVMQVVIASNRYLYRRNQNRLPEVLKSYILDYSDTTFLALFRMHRESFWKLVEILIQAGGSNYWDHREVPRGYWRPPEQQIAVGLFMLGGGGGTAERSQIALNIGHGTI